MHIDNKEDKSTLGDEIIAALGVSIGALVGLIADNLILGLISAAGLLLLARVYCYARIKKRQQD